MSTVLSSEAHATETVETSPAVSVVVRTFNEQKHLPALFQALARQTRRDFEVIVVDSGSFDRTRAIAEAHADQVIRIPSHDFTFGYSLNVGIRAAKGRFVVLCSAHTIPCDENWLDRLVAPLAEDGVAMVYGDQRGVASSKFSEVTDLRRTFGPQPRVEQPGRFAVNNANSALRKDLWEHYAFDEALTGLEDIDWARHWMAKGYRVVYEPAASLFHIHEESWLQVRRRFYREAVARRQMGLLGRRHIPAEVCRECRLAVTDLAAAVTSAGNPVGERLARGKRFKEVLLYRANKLAGTVRGLLESNPMETREECEKVLFDRFARAVVIYGPGKASLEKVAISELKPGEVLVAVNHVAVCATELEILDGALGYYQSGMAKFPIVPGHEFSGRIAAVGARVTDFSEGDAVVVECIQSCGTCEECRAGNFIGCAERTEVGVMGRNGAYAEYMVTPARFVHRIPVGLELRTAALAEPTAVILKALRRLGPDMRDGNGRSCSVLGAGPLGHLCAKVMTAYGWSVTVYDRNPARLALFDGTPIAVNGDLAAAVRANLVVEITGDPHVLNTALHGSPANATLLLLGLPYGKTPFSFEAIVGFDKTVVGSVGSTAEDFDAALGLLPKLDLSAHLRCSMPLESFEAAWEKSRKGEALKVILDVEHE